MTASQHTDHSDRIVVGVDGSKCSIEALRWAGEIATATGASIDAIIAWQLPVNYGFSAMPGNWQPEVDAQTVLNDVVVGAFGAAPPAGLRTFVRQGHPAQTLLDASEGARMLVVGSRGHGGFVGMLLGSVSAYCAEHADCPVVVYH